MGGNVSIGSAAPDRHNAVGTPLPNRYILQKATINGVDVLFFSSDPWRKLKRRIGASKVLDREEDRMVYAVDASYTAPPGNHDPDVVVLPESVEDTIEAVRAAADAGVPVIPRGKGTGMSAGSVPIGGGMVIATEKLRRIREVNVNQRWIQCETGLTCEEVKLAAGRHRLFYPPDPSSYRISSIGGNIAENAGGLRCVKYGTTKDYVLGLRYISPDGELISTGALGYADQPFDLTPLLVGSEGLFGLIVEAQLGLLPQPKTTRTLLAHFDDPYRAISAIHTILPELVPSVLEFMDEAVIRAISGHDPYPFPEGTRAALLIETDGDRDDCDREAARVAEILEEQSALEIHAAADISERERLWELRRLISPSLSRLADGKMNEDVVVPISRLGDLIRACAEISEHYDVMIPIYGHAGDGNLHLNGMYNRTDLEAGKRAHDAILACFKTVVEMGGTISGEHGIGASKNEYMELQFSEDELEVLRSMKTAFDPLGRFNPKKVLP
ncbi:MAG: FAD-linked oxidase C-terminal domain-containing protein [bacterium]